MLDVEQSFYITQKLKAHVKKVVDQGSQLNMRCFCCGDSQKHKQKRRCYFYKRTNSMYCFNCNETLIGLNIVARLENRPYKEVKTEYYMEKYGKDFKPKNTFIPKQEREKVDLSIFDTKLPPEAFTYLQQRKILEAPFLYPDMEFMYDDKSKRLVIPWYFNEKPIYYQKRTLTNQSPPYLFPKVDKGVFNIDMVDPTFPYIFIIEGAFDAIFVKNGVAIGGKTLSDYQRKLLAERWPKHELVYFLDNHRHDDEKKGPAPMYKHLLKLTENEAQVKFLLWPEQLTEFKDVNQWIVAGGKNIFGSQTWLERNIISSLRVKFIINSEINRGVFK
jgi:hypothetical protein